MRARRRYSFAQLRRGQARGAAEVGTIVTYGQQCEDAKEDPLRGRPGYGLPLWHRSGQADGEHHRYDMSVYSRARTEGSSTPLSGRRSAPIVGEDNDMPAAAAGACGDHYERRDGRQGRAIALRRWGLIWKRSWMLLWAAFFGMVRGALMKLWYQAKAND